MSIRYRIADWISGGELTRRDTAWRHWRDHSVMWRDSCHEAWLADKGRIEALMKIAAMETIHANATVRRMAKVAREALAE